MKPGMFGDCELAWKYRRLQRDSSGSDEIATRLRALEQEIVRRWLDNQHGSYGVRPQVEGVPV